MKQMTGPCPRLADERLGDFTIFYRKASQPFFVGLERFEMDLPVYFELDGKYAAMLPADDGGVIVAIDPGISIADCMDHGHRISEEKLPDDFLNFMKQ